MPRTRRSAVPVKPGEDSLTRAVGENLRRLRTERGWSMDELAARSGVSKTMLHQVEIGKSIPTIAVVWRMADGLQVQFSDLLSSRAPDSDVVLTRSAAKYLSNAEGTFSSRALFPFGGAARTAEFYELRIKPGGIERAGAHARGTVEHLALVSGCADVDVAERRHRLEVGDCLVFAADRPHIYANPSATHKAHLFLMMAYALPGQVHA